MFAVDTLKYSEEFEKAKFTKAQSKILASSIKQAQEDSIGNLVTKNELKLTENAIRSEIDSVRTELKSEIQSVRTELKSEIKRVEEKIDSTVHKSTLRLIIAIPTIMTAINYFMKL